MNQLGVFPVFVEIIHVQLNTNKSKAFKSLRGVCKLPPPPLPHMPPPPSPISKSTVWFFRDSRKLKTVTLPNVYSLIFTSAETQR